MRLFIFTLVTSHIVVMTSLLFVLLIKFIKHQIASSDQVAGLFAARRHSTVLSHMATSLWTAIKQHIGLHASQCCFHMGMHAMGCNVWPRCRIFMSSKALPFHQAQLIRELNQDDRFDESVFALS